MGGKRGERWERRKGGGPNWLGRGPPRATPQEGDGTGEEHQGEPSPDDLCSVVCVHAGRREPQGGMHGEEGKKTKKNKEKNPTAPPEGVKHRASRRRGNGTEQTGRRETAGGAREKTKEHNNSAGDQVGKRHG